MGQKPNTICKICGKEYYCCAGSQKIGGYKSICCSPECFQEWCKKIDERNSKAKSPAAEVAEPESQFAQIVETDADEVQMTDPVLTEVSDYIYEVSYPSAEDAEEN